MLCWWHKLDKISPILLIWNFFLYQEFPKWFEMNLKLSLRVGCEREVNNREQAINYAHSLIYGICPVLPVISDRKKNDIYNMVTLIIYRRQSPADLGLPNMFVLHRINGTKTASCNPTIPRASGLGACISMQVTNCGVVV